MLDHVLLGLVSTATAVGFYSFSVRAVRVSATLVTDSFLVFFPRIVALGSQRAIDEVQQKLRVNLQFILLLALPMGMGLFLLADDIALYFFGNKFAGVGYNLRILAFFPLLKGFSLFLSNPILIAHHREINFLRNLVVSTGLFVVAALIAGYYAADTGICWSLLGAELVLIALNYRSVSRVLPQLPVTDRRTLLHGLGGVLLFIPVVLLLRSAGIDGWLFLLIAVVSCKLVYFGFLIFVVRNTFAQRLWQLGRSLSFKRNK
jgi:O-antigen/teichoic acid export membrane protein